MMFDLMNRQKKSALSVVFVIVLTTLLTMVSSRAIGHEFDQQLGKETVEKFSKTDFVYALIDNEKYQEAHDTLAMISSICYTEDLSACWARLYARMGDNKAALALYAKSNDNDASVEYELLRKTCSTEYDIVLLEHMDNYMPELNNKEQIIDANHTAQQNFKTKLNDFFSKFDGGTEQRLIEIIEEIDDLYDNTSTISDTTRENINGLLDEIKRITNKNDFLLELPYVRNSREKALMLTGDYDTILKNVDENSTDKEYLDVSELYLRDLINEKTLTKTFPSEDEKALEVVYNKLTDISFEGKNTQICRQARALAKDIKKKTKNMGVYALCSTMNDVAGESGDPSKLYLQMSRLAYNEEDETSAREYLMNAVDNAQQSGDQDFREPMVALSNVLNDSTDSESLKKVSQAAKQAVDQVGDYLCVPNSVEEKKNAYYSFASSAISEEKASMVISSVNADNFPQIELLITAEGISESKIESELKVEDCDKQVVPTSIERLKYEGVNVILVCDVSGSMAGDPIVALKDAVKSFIEEAGAKEKIGIVTFDSYVQETIVPTNDYETIKNVVDNIYADGGTNIYDAAQTAISMLPKEKNNLNMIIIMSDGADGNAKSEQIINDTIVQPCKDAGILLYTIGIGEADANYLSYYSKGTGGSFLYADNADEISNFYSFVRNLSDFRYRITYKALDTLTVSRKVKVYEEKNDKQYGDTKYYSINQEQDPGEEAFSRGKEVKKYFLTNVSGLDIRQIIQSDKSTEALLYGNGFKESDTITVKARGNLEYTLKTEYVSPTQYKVVIPGKMAVDIYEIIVTINDDTAYFKNELVVCKELSEYSFGPYVFTAGLKTTSEDGSIHLMGNVRLNGWLCFNGNVIISPRDKESIILSDYDGSTVSYSRADELTGLAKLLANDGCSLNIEPFEDVILYNDKLHYASDDEYNTIPKEIDMIIPNFMSLSKAGIRIYPDRLVIDLNEFTTKFVMMDKIIKPKYTSIAETDDFFKYKLNHDIKITLTNKNFGLYAKLSGKDFQDYKKDKDAFSWKMKLGNTEIKMKKESAEIEIDTLKAEYSIMYKVYLPVINEGKDDLGVGFKFALKENKVSELRVYADFDIDTMLGTCPVTFSDFELAVKDIDNGNISKWTFEGVTSIEVGKLSNIGFAKKTKGIFKNSKSITDFIDDACLVEFEDSTLSLCLGEKNLKVSTNAKFLGKMDIGHIKIDIGHFTETEALLSMRDESVTGLSAELGAQLKLKTNNCDIGVAGSIKMDLTSGFIGIIVKGNATVEVEWWVFEKDVDLDGSAAIGVRFPQDGEKYFVLTAKGTTKKNKMKTINIEW